MTKILAIHHVIKSAFDSYNHRTLSHILSNLPLKFYTEEGKQMHIFTKGVENNNFHYLITNDTQNRIKANLPFIVQC